MGWMNFLPLVCCSVQPPPCPLPACLSGKVRVGWWSEWWAQHNTTQHNTPLTRHPPAGINHQSGSEAQHYTLSSPALRSVPLTRQSPYKWRREEKIFLDFRFCLISLMTTLAVDWARHSVARQTRHRIWSQVSTNWIFRLSTLLAHDSWINREIWLKCGSLHQLAVKLIILPMFPPHFLSFLVKCCEI